MMSRIGQFFGRMGLATLRISPNRNAGGGGGGGDDVEDRDPGTLIAGI